MPQIRSVVRDIAIMAVTVGMCAVIGLITTGKSEARPLGATPTQYVALGDSYTSGPFIPLQTGQPPGCARSDHNYPSMVSGTLHPAIFRDVSCSGATTNDMTAPQTTSQGTNDPQLNALTGKTDLVTLGIGGNDIGFAQVIVTCAKISSTRLDGAACRDYYNRGGTDELAQRIRATVPKIASVLNGIRSRSSGATIVVVGYPTILPDSGPGCYPIVPLSAGDVAYLRQAEKTLNAMLADQAGRAGAEFADTYRSSIGHDVCQLPGTKWLEGLVPTAPAAPFHPNELGMRNSANAVLRALHTQILAGR
jgi:lysophospholipase L1-like esterase